MVHGEDDTEQQAMAALRARGLDLKLNSEQRRAWQEGFNRLPAMQVFGALVDLDEARLIKVVLPKIEAHHQGGLGGEAVNGALLAGMFDCAIGVAGLHQFPTQKGGTVELSIKYLRPVREAPLTIYAVATKTSVGVAFAESLLFSGGQYCANCTGMFALTSSGQQEVVPGGEGFSFF